MPHYVGLDVSQKTTAICVVDEQGKRQWRGECATDPEAISARLLKHAGVDAKVGSRPARCRPGSSMASAVLAMPSSAWTPGK
jgi:transposase